MLGVCMSIVVIEILISNMNHPFFCFILQKVPIFVGIRRFSGNFPADSDRGVKWGSLQNRAVQLGKGSVKIVQCGPLRCL